MGAVEIETKARVMTIILNRPELRNAVDGLTARALADAFRRFEADDSVYVGVLWGKGGNFCAGADLKAIFSGKNPNQVEESGDGPMGPTRMVLKKPVIAGVAGYAVAGGFELALWCDLRVMEKSAVFGFFNRRFGVPLIDGGTIRLPRLIGLSRAMDLILTGRAVSAEEALSIGLANLVVEDGNSREEAEKLAEKIAEFPQASLQEDRLSAIEQFDMSFQSALKNEFRHGMRAIDSSEFKEGVKKFISGKGRHGEF